MKKGEVLVKELVRLAPANSAPKNVRSMVR